MQQEHSGYIDTFRIHSDTLIHMIHSGLLVTGMQKFKATLKVPLVSVRTLIKKEREITVIIEKVAKKSFPIFRNVFPAQSSSTKMI